MVLRMSAAVVVALSVQIGMPLAAGSHADQFKSQNHYLSAKHLLESGQFDLAKKSLKKALAEAPDHIGALVLSSQLAAQKDQTDRAIAYLEHADAVLDDATGKLAEQRLVVAEGYTKLGKYDEAESLLLRVLAGPKLDVTALADILLAARTFIAIAVLSRHQGDIKKSQANFKAAENLVSRLDANADPVRLVRDLWLDEVAELEFQRGDMDSAIHALSNLLGRYVNVGSGKLKEAVSVAHRLGVIAREAGRLQEAEKFLKLAAEVSSAMYGSRHPASIEMQEDLVDLLRSAI